MTLSTSGTKIAPRFEAMREKQLAAQAQRETSQVWWLFQRSKNAISNREDGFETKICRKNEHVELKTERLKGK